MGTEDQRPHGPFAIQADTPQPTSTAQTALARHVEALDPLDRTRLQPVLAALALETNRIEADRIELRTVAEALEAKGVRLQGQQAGFESHLLRLETLCAYLDEHGPKDYNKVTVFTPTHHDPDKLPPEHRATIKVHSYPFFGGESVYVAPDGKLLWLQRTEDPSVPCPDCEARPRVECHMNGGCV